MDNSKPIKGSFPYGRPPSNKLVDWVKEHTIYPVLDFWSTYTERISRSWAFARLGWLNYDFDGQFIWPLLAFKLKRIYPVLVNGTAVQQNEDMNALSEAIAICDRLANDDYDQRYHAIHDAMYGKLEVRDDRVADHDKKGKPLTYFLDFHRAGVTKDNEAQERADHLAIYQQSEKDWQDDVDRLAFILKTYSRRWWD